MRKEAGFEITDRIDVRFTGDAEVVDAIAAYESYVAGEILADTLKPVAKAASGAQDWDLNGRQAAIAVRKK